MVCVRFYACRHQYWQLLEMIEYFITDFSTMKVYWDAKSMKANKLDRH